MMAYDNITRLIQQAKAGGAEAFGALYEPMAKDAYRYALYSLGAPGPAEDAVQEAALAAWRGIAGLRDPARLKPWFFRILANECRRQLREKIAQRQREDADALELPGGGAPLGRAMELRQALAALPEAERETVLLHVLEGWTEQEIARSLGCPAGTVRARHSRAMAKLRKELDEYA